MIRLLAFARWAGSAVKCLVQLHHWAALECTPHHVRNSTPQSELGHATEPARRQIGQWQRLSAKARDVCRADVTVHFAVKFSECNPLET